MKKYMTVAVCALLPLFFAGVAQKKVAEFDGGTISQQELEQAASRRLNEIAQNTYRVQYETLVDLTIKRLSELEARRQNISVKQLKEKYVKKSFQGFSVETAQKYYEENRDDFDAEFEDIRFGLLEYLNKKEKDKILQNFYRELIQKYKVKFFLDEPQISKFAHSREVMLTNTQDDPRWGNEKSKVILVEFSDLECPYCKRMQEVIAKARQQYENKILYIFRDFPLGFHFRAKQAHVANNCALEQNKYFEFQKAAFEISPDLSLKKLNQIAQKIGLNMKRYEACMKNNFDKHIAEIDQDMEDAQNIGVQGTPALFLNGVSIGGYIDFETLQEKIEEALRDTK